MIPGPFQDMYTYLYQFLVCWLHPCFFQVCTSRITLQKNQLKPGIMLPGHKTTCALEAVAFFQIQSAMPLTLLIPGCITVTALKFPEPVKLHLCMAGSPSVLIGLSSPVLRSHQCLFGVEAFLCLKLFTQLDLVGNLRGSPVHI